MEVSEGILERDLFRFSEVTLECDSVATKPLARDGPLLRGDPTQRSVGEDEVLLPGARHQEASGRVGTRRPLCAGEEESGMNMDCVQRLD